jgi:hypothetical protein
MAENKRFEEGLKSADRKYKAWVKSMKAKGYVVRGNHAFKQKATVVVVQHQHLKNHHVKKKLSLFVQIKV